MSGLLTQQLVMNWTGELGRKFRITRGSIWLVKCKIVRYLEQIKGNIHLHSVANFVYDAFCTFSDRLLPDILV